MPPANPQNAKQTEPKPPRVYLLLLSVTCFECHAIELRREERGDKEKESDEERLVTVLTSQATTAREQEQHIFVRLAEFLFTSSRLLFILSHIHFSFSSYFSFISRHIAYRLAGFVAQRKKGETSAKEKYAPIRASVLSFAALARAASSVRLYAYVAAERGEEEKKKRRARMSADVLMRDATFTLFMRDTI